MNFNFEFIQGKMYCTMLLYYVYITLNAVLMKDTNAEIGFFFRTEKGIDYLAS